MLYSKNGEGFKLINGTKNVVPETHFSTENKVEIEKKLPNTASPTFQLFIH